MSMFKYSTLFVILVTCFGCNKDEISPIDKPFVHIMKDELSSIKINSNRRDVVSYYVYFSSKEIKEDLTVDYSIEVGNGLKKGIDFKILTKENPLLFPNGIYKRPIQIRWLDHQVDPNKDNSIRIIIDGNNLGVSTGLPGPDNKQSELVITKVDN